MGRKGVYEQWLTPENLLKLEAWARDGLSHADIAHNIGISLSRLYVWRDKYKDIDNALAHGREVADIRVENALYKRAMGYDYEEIVHELRKDKETGEERMIETKRILRHVQPDVSAQTFWLKNRRADLWKDKREVQTDINGVTETGVALLAPVKTEGEPDGKKDPESGN